MEYQTCVVHVCIYVCMYVHVLVFLCTVILHGTRTAGVLQNIVNKNSFMRTVQLHLKYYMPLSAEISNTDLMLY